MTRRALFFVATLLGLALLAGACNALQALADDNGITVDLSCQN